jgi:hypothetical protein
VQGRGRADVSRRRGGSDVGSSRERRGAGERTGGAAAPGVAGGLADGEGHADDGGDRVLAALRRAGVPEEEVKRFMEEAWTAGSYDGLLQTILKWVEVVQ